MIIICNYIITRFRLPLEFPDEILLFLPPSPLRLALDVYRRRVLEDSAEENRDLKTLRIKSI